VHDDGQDRRRNNPVQVPDNPQLTRFTLGSFRSSGSCVPSVLETTNCRVSVPSTAGRIQFPETGYLAIATLRVPSGSRTTSSDVTAAEESESSLFSGLTERLHQRASISLAEIL
jgi:hypothetical protein